MPEQLTVPDSAPQIDDENDNGRGVNIRSRSPHPYHRQNFELLEPSEQLSYRPARNAHQANGDIASAFTKESTPASDTGTEADDENFLKRLPAPKSRLHKGLRGTSEPLSGTSTPLPSPAILEEEGRRPPLRTKHGSPGNTKRGDVVLARRRRELARRIIECGLVACAGGFVGTSREMPAPWSLWRRDIAAQCLAVAALLFLYPVRVVLWAYRHGKPSKAIPLVVPPSFDPASILYPQTIPMLVALLVDGTSKAVMLPTLVLSLCTLPSSLIPTAQYLGPINATHWLLSCIPIFLEDQSPTGLDTTPYSKEILLFLYPLHQQLCMVLHQLTTTSLLAAELQLLSVALINILILAKSPQAVILKAVLWGGSLGILVSCSSVIRWGVALARVPKWRFRRVAPASKVPSTFQTLRTIISTWRSRSDLPATDFEDSAAETVNSSDDSYELHTSPASARKEPRQTGGTASTENVSISPLDGTGVRSKGGPTFLHPSGRLTLASSGKTTTRSSTHTPSGRRKRSASSTVRSFFSLTQAQAIVRKWIYAGYVYVCVLGIILVGIREYVKRNALSGNEPIGWALGYLFGDLPWFRFQVVKANLERWICLPTRPSDDDAGASARTCRLGWAAQIRHSTVGEANTRLVLCAYWVAIVVTGLAVVLRLSPVYEVDTRRKVFHFMMVGMFLPATYVDPAFAALALALVLAVFLLLDLLRASQLPPLSRPIAAFLAPYVDGRDLRGPVVISHIFLLIGCAIPLWLSLAALPRSPGDGPFAGWDVPTRDVSMVSGVVCVGLGDAAASLIGRRWGRRKWPWGGGKSLEGSVAFAIAVFAGLMAAHACLRIGGWPATSDASSPVAPDFAPVSWSSALGSLACGATARKTAVCASMASLTEAVLTGGNDNVIVPIVLWTCVKSLGI